MLKAFPKLLVLLKSGDYDFQSVGVLWMVTGLVMKECGIIDQGRSHERDYRLMIDASAKTQSDKSQRTFRSAVGITPRGSSLAR